MHTNKHKWEREYKSRGYEEHEGVKTTEHTERRKLYFGESYCHKDHDNICYFFGDLLIYNLCLSVVSIPFFSLFVPFVS